MSTLTLEYFQEREIEVEEVKVPGFLNQIGGALKKGWQGLLHFILKAIAAWPIWLALVVAIFLGRRMILAQRKRVKAVK